MDNNLIQEYENLLRQVIILILQQKYQNAYEDHFAISSERINKWKEKLEEERKKYKGILPEQRVLFYSDFYDLKTIIDKNWELFSPILHKKRDFDTFFEQVEKFRNTIAHGRYLFSHHESLLSGIVGDLKDLIVQYRNKNESAADYYLRLLKVSDNYGNQWIPIVGERRLLHTGTSLRIGDIVEFHVDAADPKGRSIKYVLRPVRGNHENLNGLRYQIAVNDVGSNFVLDVAAYTETKYRNEESVWFYYSVLPEDD